MDTLSRRDFLRDVAPKVLVGLGLVGVGAIGLETVFGLGAQYGANPRFNELDVDSYLALIQFNSLIHRQIMAGTPHYAAMGGEGLPVHNRDWRNNDEIRRYPSPLMFVDPTVRLIKTKYGEGDQVFGLAKCPVAVVQYPTSQKHGWAEKIPDVTAINLFTPASVLGFEITPTELEKGLKPGDLIENHSSFKGNLLTVDRCLSGQFVTAYLPTSGQILQDHPAYNQVQEEFDSLHLYAPCWLSKGRLASIYTNYGLNPANGYKPPTHLRYLGNVSVSRSRRLLGTPSDQSFFYSNNSPDMVADRLPYGVGRDAVKTPLSGWLTGVPTAIHRAVEWGQFGLESMGIVGFSSGLPSMEQIYEIQRIWDESGSASFKYLGAESIEQQVEAGRSDLVRALFSAEGLKNRVVGNQVPMLKMNE
jgi:hypothetical protein